MSPSPPVLSLVPGAALLALAAVTWPRWEYLAARWFAMLLALLGGGSVLLVFARRYVLVDVTLPFAFSLLMVAPAAWFVYAWRYAGRDDTFSAPVVAFLFSYPALFGVLATWRGLTRSMTRELGLVAAFDPLEVAMLLDLVLPMLLVLLAWLVALLAGGAVVLVREGDPAVGLVATASVVVPLVAVGLLRRRIGVPVEVTWSGVGFAIAAVGFAVVWFALPWDPADGRAADE